MIKSFYLLENPLKNRLYIEKILFSNHFFYEVVRKIWNKPGKLLFCEISTPHTYLKLYAWVHFSMVTVLFFGSKDDSWLVYLYFKSSGQDNYEAIARSRKLSFQNSLIFSYFESRYQDINWLQILYFKTL